MRLTILSFGFRPFFLLAGIYAIIPLIPWLLFLNNSFTPPSGISLIMWHAHEMIFGFAAAAISGFLLTAVPNWTGSRPIAGSRLGLLVAFWLIGRLALWSILYTSGSVIHYFIFLDILHLTALSAMLGRVIVESGNRHNYIFIVILAGLTIANILVLLQLSGIAETGHIGTILATNIILLIVATIGGRITPSFTRGSLENDGISHNIRSFAFLEKLAPLSILAIILAEIVSPDGLIGNILALPAFFIHAVRYFNWCGHKTLNKPILWVLHLGYLWLVISLLLKSAELFTNIPPNLYLHALTLGALGAYVLGMMSRASLGHTGRPLVVKLPIVAAYLLASLAAIIRLITPVFFIDFYNEGILLSALLWGSAFVCFLWVYLPILIMPKVERF